MITRLVDKIVAEGLHSVDSRKWKTSWSKRWVVYVDLIGFAARCLRSKDVVTNNIVRFHRCVKMVSEALTTLTLHQFTDCCFGILEDEKTAIQWASNLMHATLAQNIIYLSTKQGKRFNHIILPRITIGNGEVLIPDCSLLPEAEKLGLKIDRLLAGDGIVKAHQIEKNSFGGAISFATAEREKITAIPINDKSLNSKSAFKRWGRSSAEKHLEHDKVVDFPYLFLNPQQDYKKAVSFDEDVSFKEKTVRLKEILSLFKLEYSISHAPVEVAKHIGGLERHLSDIEKIFKASPSRSKK